LLNEFDFDDSDVVDFFDEKNNIVLKVKYVTDKNQMLVNGIVTFANVKSVIFTPGLIGHEAPEKIGMYYKDGSIIHFEQKKEDMVLLMIEWDDLASGDHTWHIYEIYSDSIQWGFEETGLHCNDPRPYED